MLTTRVGELTVHVLQDGAFRLDGGAMFGVVPKVVWERALPADDRNRVTLAANCLLVEAADGRRILCDTGLGERWTDRERDRFAIETPRRLPAELAELGLGPEDVDLVILSHLHFDHAGGATTTGADGSPEPAFPNATYWVQAWEREEARRPHERHRASYRREDWEPLETAGCLHVLEGDAEVAPGVFVELAPGHCPGLQVIRVESAGETLVFPSDLVPTSSHLPPAWNMGFDLDVRAVVNAKRRLLERARSGGWRMCFDHDPDIPLADLVEEERRGEPVLRAVPAAVQEAS